MTTTSKDWCSSKKTDENFGVPKWFVINRLDWVEMSDSMLNHFARTEIMVKADSIAVIEPVNVRYDYANHSHCNLRMNDGSVILVEPDYRTVKKLILGI